jgi:hypothetical protein
VVDLKSDIDHSVFIYKLYVCGPGIHFVLSTPGLNWSLDF